MRTGCNAASKYERIDSSGYRDGGFRKLMDIRESVTQWLQLWRDGDDQAIQQVTDLVYRDLRRLAAYYLKGESDANTLQPTALVHEAYLHLSSLREIDWKGRQQFIAVIAQMMRRILVDHARARKAAKRDFSRALDVPIALETAQPIDILAVDQALDRMAAHYPRSAQVVEFRFFGGLEFREIGAAMNLSLTTVEREWRFARAYLQDAINER